MYSQTNQTTWMNCRLAENTPDNNYVNDPINSIAQWSQDVANWFICIVFGLIHEVVWLLCTDSFVFIEFYTFTEWMSFIAVLIEGTRWYTWIAHFFAIIFFWTVAHRFFAFLQYRSHHIGPELGAVFSPMYLPYTYSSVVTKNSLYLSYVHLLGMNINENVNFIENFPFNLEKAWEMGYDLPLFWTGWIHFVNDSPAYVYGDHYSGGVSRHVENWANYKVSNMILAGGPFSFNCFGPFSYLVIHDDGDDEYPWKLGERKWYHATIPPMPEMDW